MWAVLTQVGSPQHHKCPLLLTQGAVIDTAQAPVRLFKLQSSALGQPCQHTSFHLLQLSGFKVTTQPLITVAVVANTVFEMPCLRRSINPCQPKAWTLHKLGTLVTYLWKRSYTSLEVLYVALVLADLIGHNMHAARMLNACVLQSPISLIFLAVCGFSLTAHVCSAHHLVMQSTLIRDTNPCMLPHTCVTPVQSCFCKATASSYLKGVLFSAGLSIAWCLRWICCEDVWAIEDQGLACSCILSRQWKVCKVCDCC